MLAMYFAIGPAELLFLTVIAALFVGTPVAILAVLLFFRHRQRKRGEDDRFYD